MSAAFASTALIALLNTQPYHPAPLAVSDTVADVVGELKAGSVFGVLARPVPLSIPEIICSQPWPCQQALAVSWCESRHDPRALSPSGHRGLMQISPIHAGMVGGNLDALFDPVTNVRVGYQLYAARGNSWGAWSCKP